MPKLKPKFTTPEDKAAALAGMKAATKLHSDNVKSVAAAIAAAKKANADTLKALRLESKTLDKTLAAAVAKLAKENEEKRKDMDKKLENAKKEQDALVVREAKAKTAAVEGAARLTKQSEAIAAVVIKPPRADVKKTVKVIAEPVDA